MKRKERNGVGRKTIDNFGGYMTNYPELSNKTIPKNSYKPQNCL